MDIAEPVKRMLERFKSGESPPEPEWKFLFEMIFLEGVHIGQDELDVVFRHLGKGNEAMQGWVPFYKGTNGFVHHGETACHTAKALVAHFKPGKAFAMNEFPLQSFMRNFPEYNEILLEKLLDGETPVDREMWDLFGPMWTDARMMRVIPANMMVLETQIQKMSRGELIANFPSIMKRWRRALKKADHRSANNLMECLPAECWGYLTDIGEIGIKGKNALFRAVLKQPAGIPERLAVKAVVELYWLHEKHDRMKDVRDYVTVSFPITFPDWLIGDDLAKVLLFLDRNVGPDNAKQAAVMPDEETIKTRLADLLLSGDSTKRSVYNQAVEIFLKFDSAKEMGSDAVSKARLLLRRVANENSVGITDVVTFSDDRKIYKGLIRRFRELNDDDLWEMLPDVIYLVHTRGGPYAREMGARKLIEVLNSKVMKEPVK